VTAADLRAQPRPAPVLLGDRLQAIRAALGGGAVTLAIVLVLGVAFLVAGLRLAPITFTDGGTSYTASCGIETVLVGSSWDALATACRDGAGMRILAVVGGTMLVLGGLGQLAWVGSRRAGERRSAWRRMLEPRSGRLAALGVVVATVVAAAAALVARARLDAAALTGDCLPGSGACPSDSGLAGGVQVAAVLAAVAAGAVLVRPLLAGRSPVTTIGVAVAALAVVLLALAGRPVAVETGTGPGDLRATCGVEILLAGHPQPTVTAACRDAMGSRAAAGAAGLLLGTGAGVLLLAGRRSAPAGASDAAAPGSADDTLVEVAP
jgi:hypothetical protein